MDTSEGWEWHYSLQEEWNYWNIGNTWHYFFAFPSSARSWTGKFIGGDLCAINDVPQSLCWAAVRWFPNNSLCLMGYAPNALPPNDNNGDLLTMDAWINTSSPKIKWGVQSCAMTDGGATVAKAIWKGRAIAVSDSSYKDNFGTAAYVLEGDTSNHCIVAVMVVPGDYHSQSHFHSELAGLYSIIHMVDLLCQTFGITTGSIQIRCDGLSALTQTFEQKWHDTKAIQKADFDLLSAPHGALWCSPLTWKY